MCITRFYVLAEWERSACIRRDACCSAFTRKGISSYPTSQTHTLPVSITLTNLSTYSHRLLTHLGFLQSQPEMVAALQDTRGLPSSEPPVRCEGQRPCESTCAYASAAASGCCDMLISSDIPGAGVWEARRAQDRGSNAVCCRDPARGAHLPALAAAVPHLWTTRQPWQSAASCVRGFRTCRPGELRIKFLSTRHTARGPTHSQSALMLRVCLAGRHWD